jgi:signal transduction histidine kinase
MNGESEGATVLVVDGRIDDASDSCAVVFRRPVDDITGRKLTDLEAEGVLETGFVESFRSAVRAGESETFVGGVRSAPDEEPYRYEVTVDPRGETAVCTFQDVGTQYRYEATVDSLNGITRELMAADTQFEVLTKVADAANRVLEFPGVGVREYDPESERLEHVAFGGVVNEIETRPGFEVEKSPHGKAFRRQATVIDEIPDEDDPFDREEFSHTMYVPIGDFGVLSLGRVGGPFDRADVHFAEILADNAQAALEQVERERRLREQRERLEERNERLDEFASIVSHDLRNPLGVAKGCLEAYEETENESFVEDVADALDRMEEIIDGMLTLAREGRTVDRIQQTPLRDLARRAWHNAETGSLELRVETDRTVVVDPERIKRLLENCYRNVVEHAETATEVVVDDMERGFYVADDGAGIPSEERDSVLESGYTTASDGNGFGLAIVSRIARAHGFSTAVAESEAGGARIEVHGDVFADR